MSAIVDRKAKQIRRIITVAVSALVVLLIIGVSKFFVLVDKIEFSLGYWFGVEDLTKDKINADTATEEIVRLRLIRMALEKDLKNFYDQPLGKLAFDHAVNNAKSFKQVRLRRLEIEVLQEQSARER